MASIAGDGRHILLALNPSVKTDVQLVDYATLDRLQCRWPTCKALL